MSKDLEIPLDDPSNWETEKGSEKPEAEPDYSNLSDVAVSYLAQMKDLQQQLQEEYIKIQRLEMALRGFNAALQEEIKGP